MPNIVFESKQYDTGSSPEVTFTPPIGTVWDLQEPGMVVTFIARLPGSASPKIEKLATVTGPWSVRFDPVAADVNALGTYDVEWECLRANMKKITLPTHGYLQWLIGPDLNNK